MIDEETARRGDRIDRALRQAARCGLAAVIEKGVEGWDRRRMLPRLIPIGPEELLDESHAGRLAVLKRIASALRGERTRGRAGHWSYSLDRHLGLVQALAAERRALPARDRRGVTDPPPAR